jgi:hypothetical protein
LAERLGASTVHVRSETRGLAPAAIPSRGRSALLTFGWNGSATFAPERRRVRGVDHLEHRAAVLARHQRRLVLAHALDEVLQLVRVALVEHLFEDREGPARRRAGLLGA